MSTRKITKTITLPDGDVVTFRKLSGRHLRQCAEAQMFEQAEVVERMTSLQARITKAMSTGETPPAPDRPPSPAPTTPAPTTAETGSPAPVRDTPVPAPAVAPNPMHGFSAPELIRKGLLSVEGEDLPDEEAKSAYVDDLSQEDTEYAAEQILRLSSPKLFLTKAEAEAAQKNA